MTQPRARGHYQVSVEHGDIILTAGLTPRDATGKLVATGRVGGDLDFDEATAAARQTARNAATVIVRAAGGRDNLDALLRLTVYIACEPGFTRHSELADVISTELETLLDLDRLPVRTAVGVSSLPGNAPVEIDLIAATRRSSRPPVRSEVSD